MSTKVGLVTARLSRISSPSATARTRKVFPAQSAAIRRTTLLGKSNRPSRRPNAAVAVRSERSRTSAAGTLLLVARGRQRGLGIAGFETLQLLLEIGPLAVQ